jgi:hypothetical protein
MTDQEKENLEHMAGLLFLDTELDDYLEQPRGTVAAAVASETSEIGRVVRRARMMCEAETMASVKLSAIRHSTPAQEMMVKRLTRLKSQ